MLIETVKRLLLTAFILCLAVISVSAQEFDITGSYYGSINGMYLRMDILEPIPGAYLFLTSLRDGDGFTFEVETSSINEYRLDLEGTGLDLGENLDLVFDGVECTFSTEYFTRTLQKKVGSSDEIVGTYSYMEAGEGELILEAERIATGFKITLEFWEVDWPILCHPQKGNLFEVADDWHEYTVEFARESCIVTERGESFTLERKR